MKTLLKTLCVLLAPLITAGCASSSQSAAAAPARDEMLVNGNFANGNANWILEQNAGATAQVDCVQEGPDGKAALRLKVLTISGEAWHLQLFQKGLRVEKDKTYVLTFWAKSDRAGDITVNCMQNHAPWDHHVQKVMTLSNEWKQMQFTFAGPWDDDNARISFTNLGTAVGQTYWFADCSLVEPPVKQVVVWDGEQANKGAGWTNPKTLTIAPQTIETHSGNSALQFKFQGDGSAGWLGAGWNWCAFKTGPYGTDITAMKNFTFWVKNSGNVADLQINLLCNGEVFDMPQHHTSKVSVLKYCPELRDGQWHHVSIPLTDFTQPAGFDAVHVGELQMFNAGAGDGSYFFDDLAYDDAPGDGVTEKR